jgi:hypothetical protein
MRLLYNVNMFTKLGGLMPTKTFSGRVDADKLAFANSLTQQRFGLSFGQYCSGVLLNVICDCGALPDIPSQSKNNKAEGAVDFIKGFSAVAHDKTIGRMTDNQIDELIAGRYA